MNKAGVLPKIDRKQSKIKHKKASTILKPLTIPKRQIAILNSPPPECSIDEMIQAEVIADV